MKHDSHPRNAVNVATRSRESLQLKSKQPQRVAEGSRALESHFDLVLSDTDCFERAICEYRETSWDDSSFEELSFEAQQRILRRAQEIKDCQHRPKAVAGVRHPIAS
jgi:hypothetical protein